ncbi:MAG: outer membrane protein assembly factor BamA [Chthoniobacteraceae bacterium]
MPPAAAILIALSLFRADVFAAVANVIFPGATSFKEENLRGVIVEQLNEISISGLTVARADDAAFFLGAYYRKQGFASAEVTYEIRGALLILKVREGPRTFVQSLAFEGNRAFESKVLEEYMIGLASGRLAESKLAFNETEIAEGAGRIAAYYQSEGFLDVKVETTGTRITATGRGADVVVRISEGPKYFLGAITFTGQPVIPRKELLGALALKDGAPFTPYAVDEMQRTLRGFYRSKGYFNAKVEVRADRALSRGGHVPVIFVCEPGPRFRVGRVVPRGTDRLSPEFMEKRFEPLMGRVYDPEQLEMRYRALMKTGLFKTLHVRPVQDGPDTLKLDVEVEEAKAKEIGFELGYGTYDGATAGVRVGDRNFLRHGRPLSLSLQYSQRGFRGELLYVDPWLFDSDWMLRARIYSQVRDELGYSKATEGVRLELTRHFTPHWEAGGYVVGEKTDITKLQIDSRLVGSTNYTLAAVGLTQTLDYRNDISNPTRGWVFTTSADLDTLDGKLAFVRASARYSWYRAFGKTLLGVGARAGWIIPIGDEVVPIDLRFFNGGSTTVRSFAEMKLSPKDLGGNPLGGQFYTVLNAEWDFPIKGALGGAVFTDAGNLLGNSDVSLDDMRYAVGVGLRYQLPIGPVRLDYGYNPARKAGDASGAFHLSFGFAF